MTTIVERAQRKLEEAMRTVKEMRDIYPSEKDAERRFLYESYISAALQWAYAAAALRADDAARNAEREMLASKGPGSHLIPVDQRELFN